MFGWEFPPYVSGGLGIACEGLVRGLLELSTEISLVLPRRIESSTPGLRILTAGGPAAGRRPVPRTRRLRLRVRRVRTLLKPYLTDAVYEEELLAISVAAPRLPGIYGPDLHAEVLRYADEAARIAAREEFDVIHAHDWLTFMAGMRAKRASGRPLVLHVHATEFDRSGNGDNGFVVGVERARAGSRRPRRRRLRVHGGRPRVAVRRSAREAAGRPQRHRRPRARCPVDGRRGRSAGALRRADHVAEGPRLLRRRGRAGGGRDAGGQVRRGGLRRPAAPDDAARRGAGLEDRFLFTGFLPPDDLDRLYARADVYVMPSVSEPFGLTALEALQHGTPVIVSRSAGVSEVVRHLLRVQFGDVEDLASKILSVLLFPPLRYRARPRAAAPTSSVSRGASRHGAA